MPERRTKGGSASASPPKAIHESLLCILVDVETRAKRFQCRIQPLYRILLLGMVQTLRHSRTATTTDVYMQEIPESVQATVNSISRELRKSRSTQNPRATTKKKPDIAALRKGRQLQRAAVSEEVIQSLTPNDTKLERRELASC